MTRRVKVNRVMMMANIALITITFRAAEVSAAEMGAAADRLIGDELSFFDYLGTMIDDNGEWLDPLALAEQGQPGQPTEAEQIPAVPETAEDAQ